MKEQYKGVQPDGQLTMGTLLLEKGVSRKERESILKEYLSLSGSELLVKVYDGEQEVYEEVIL